jgi:hypothetical protein
VAVLVAVAVISFLAFLLALIYQDDLARVESAGSDSFSRSALGHHAFVELLRELGIPVVVSRHETARKLGARNVLLLLEPPRRDEDTRIPRRMRELVRDAPRCLVVLPKRHGWSTTDPPDRIDDHEILSRREPAEVLRELGITAELIRPGSTTAWSSGSIGGTPALDDPQLLRAPDLVPVVACREGVLVATGQAGRLVVLSDPDLLATHGLGRGDNAAIAVRLVDGLREGDGVVVVDETLHGFGIVRSRWADLFRFPLVLAVLHGLVVVAVLLWAAAGRFGAPATPPPAFGAGQEPLIANTAELLRRGGHASRMLVRYLDLTVRDVAGVLHAPRISRAGAPVSWLDRVGRERGVSLSLEALRNEVTARSRERRLDPSRLVATARRIHRWKTEILHDDARRRP